MMESEVLAEKLYASYRNAEKTDQHTWPGPQRPAGWIQLPWGERQQWRAVADTALAFCTHRVVEDWHGKAASTP
jgi:hypothetical protein